MKTPSSYPILDNRPIDQWKVAELKEELKRRKLTTTGLKNDLVRRLDEALRVELEASEEVDANHVDGTPQPLTLNDDSRVLDGNPEPVTRTDEVGVPDTSQSVAQTDVTGILDGTSQPAVHAEDIGVLDDEREKTEGVMHHDNNADVGGTCDGNLVKEEEPSVLVTSVETNITVNEVSLGEGEVQDVEGKGDVAFVKIEETVSHATSVETGVIVSKSVTHEVVMNVQNSPKNDLQSGGDYLKTEFENQESEPPHDNVKSNSSDLGNQFSEVSTNIEFQETHLETEAAKSSQDDVELSSSDPKNQVSEVSPVLGFQVKSDTVSSDNVSINEKNELKDNIIADNLKLELDVKPEMVHPSSSNVLSDGSTPHPMAVEEQYENKELVEEGDEKPAIAEMNKKNDSLDVASSEKLNLDRSSGDDSMEDDTLENKPIDSKYSSGVGDQPEKTERPVMEDEAPVDMVSDDTTVDKKASFNEVKQVPVAPVVKRKLHDQEVVANNETSKRQRRWNTEKIVVPEPQNNLASSTTLNNILPATTPKRNFSRSDSTASDEPPKERVVPPSTKPPTTSLRIDRFLRPFTLKAVQELLGKTGSVASFWMDHIKTHCYVTYSSVEEAIETRNAVYNLQWPPNGGRLLLVEFVDPQEVKMRVEAPPKSPATPISTGPTMVPPPLPPAAGQPQAHPRQHVQRQQPLPPPPSLPLPPPPPLSNPPQARERLPPPLPEKIDHPILTLDDLFRKTKATPRIYYLPLTDEQVAAKLKEQQRGRNAKQ